MKLLNKLADKVAKEYIQFLNKNNVYEDNEAQKILANGTIRLSANTTAMMLYEYEKLKESNSDSE